MIRIVENQQATRNIKNLILRWEVQIKRYLLESRNKKLPGSVTMIVNQLLNCFVKLHWHWMWILECT